MKHALPNLVIAEAIAPQPWKNGGGQTRELLAWPPGEDWQMRVSRADIESDGPFSAFPGVKRWFVVLEGGGVTLHFADGDHTLRPGDAPLQFDGALAPGCTQINGATQDLNLMVRHGSGALISVQAGQAWKPDHTICGLYTRVAGIWSDGTQTLELPAHSLLWRDAGFDANVKASWQFMPADPAGSEHCAWWLGCTPIASSSTSISTSTSTSTAPVTLWRNMRLASMAADTPWGWHAEGAMVTTGEHITWAGSSNQLPASLLQSVTREVDLGGALVTPGLIDCHTHLVYGGQRAHEFEMRLQGASYEEIARAGGGIRSTVAATRAASDAQLLQSAKLRTQALLREGVTTLEIKSGYGLTEADEARCLAVARQIGRDLAVTVRTTYLGAHALPPEFAGRQDDYVNAVCDWMPRLHAQGLVDAVDAFCENIGFTPAQTRRVFETARSLGLPVKLHAEQLSDQNGAALAAEFGALSCDHLEFLSEAGIQAMARSGTVAVMLPGAYYFLRDTHVPPIAALRQHGVPMALASDHNPGSSPGLSLLLMLNMACTLFRMTPEEALRGVTVNAAKALGLKDRGVLAAGMRADFCVWNLEHPNELAYWFGHNPCQQVFVAGQERHHGN